MISLQGETETPKHGGTRLEPGQVGVEMQEKFEGGGGCILCIAHPQTLHSVHSVNPAHSVILSSVLCT